MDLVPPSPIDEVIHHYIFKLIIIKKEKCVKKYKTFVCTNYFYIFATPPLY